MRLPASSLAAACLLLCGVQAVRGSDRPGLPDLGAGGGGLPSAAVESKAERKEARTETADASAGSPEAALDQRLADAAVERLRAIAADNQERMGRYRKDIKALAAGTFYPNAYALALLEQKQSQRFEFFKQRDSFYHGYVPSACFTLRADSASASGKGVCQFALKAGTSPSDALDALAQGLALLDCGSTVVVAYSEALRTVLGTDKFNVLFGSSAPAVLRIGWLLDRDHPLFPLVQEVPADAPTRRGHIVQFAGPAQYPFKHLNGEAANFNLLCDQAPEPGREVFVGLGLKGGGADLKALEQVFVDEFNAAPVGWELFTEKVGKAVRASYPALYLAQAERMKDARMDLAGFARSGGARCVGRYAFHVERVAALAAASPGEGLKLLAEWHGKS